MTQRPDGYRKYENDACFDALEAFEASAADHGVSMAGWRSPGCSECRR
jgi:hypothetical protein